MPKKDESSLECLIGVNCTFIVSELLKQRFNR